MSRPMPMSDAQVTNQSGNKMNAAEGVMHNEEQVGLPDLKPRLDALLWFSTVYHVDDPDFTVGAFGCCISPYAGEAGGRKRTLILGEEYPVSSGFWYIRVRVPLKSIFNFRLVLVDKESRIVFMTEELDTERTIHAKQDMSYFLPWGCAYHTAEPSPLHLEAVLPKLAGSQLKVITVDDEADSAPSPVASLSTPVISAADRPTMPKALSLQYHASESWLIQMYH